MSRVRTPYGEIIAEMERKAQPRLTVAERVAKWFDRPQREPEPAAEPDHFVWHDISDLMERAR